MSWSAGLVPSRSTNGLAFVASLEEWVTDREVCWIRLDLESLELTTSGPTVSDTDRVVARARADLVSPDGRSFLVPSTYEDAATGESRAKILRIAPDRDGTASEATFGVVDAIFDSDEILRGDEAVAWQETHGDLRRSSCIKCGATSSSIRFPTFMVGNLLVSYQYHGRIESPPSQCPKRVVLKVWRF